MVTIEESIQQVEQAEQQVAQTEKQISQAKQKAQQIKASPLTIQRQVQLQQAGKLGEFQAAGGLAGEKQRKIQEKRRTLSTISQEEVKQQQLKAQIREAKQQISAVQSAKAQQAQAEADAKLLRKVLASQSTSSPIPLSTLPARLRGQAVSTLEDKARQLSNVVVEESILKDLQKAAKEGSVEAKVALGKIGGTFRVPSKIANIEQLRLAERPAFAKQLGFEIVEPSLKPKKGVSSGVQAGLGAGLGSFLSSSQEGERTFIEKVKARGPVEPTLELLGKLGRKVSRFEPTPQQEKTISKVPFGKEFLTSQKVSKVLPEQIKEVRAKGSGFAFQVSPFLSPLSPTLLVGSGVEKFAFKERREEIFEQREGLKGTFAEGIPLVRTPGSTLFPFLPRRTLVKGSDFPVIVPVLEIAGGGFGLFRQVTKPTIKLLPKKEPTITFSEKVQPIDKGLARSKFRIDVFEPARKAQVTTPFSRAFNKPAKIIEVAKQQSRFIETAEPLIVTQKGEILGEGLLRGGRIGARGKEVSKFASTVRGGELPIELTQTSFEALPKTQQFLFRQGLQKQLGRPAPRGFEATLLKGAKGSEAQFGAGEIELQKLFRFSFKKGKPSQFKLTTFKPGRTISRADVVSVSEDITTIGRKTSTGLVTRKVSEEASERFLFGRVLFKQRSPTAISSSAKGKVTQISGITEILPPKLQDTGSSLIVITPSQVTKSVTKLSQKAIKSLSKTKALAFKALPSTRAILSKPVGSKVLSAPVTAGVLKSLSTFTPSLDSPRLGTRPGITGAVISSPSQRPTTQPRIKVVQQPMIKPILKPALKPVQKPVIKPILKPALKPALKPSLKVVQKPALKPVLKAVIKPILKPAQQFPPFGVPRLPTKSPPKSPPPIIDLGNGFSRRTETGFRVLEKRRGKFQEFRKGVFTRSEAIKIGAKRTLGTLGRTFKLVKTKQRVTRTRQSRLSARALQSFRKFRVQRGRRVPLRNIFIQRARTSLGTRGERAEIQFARKKKKKRKSLNRKKSKK